MRLRPAASRSRLLWTILLLRWHAIRLEREQVEKTYESEREKRRQAEIDEIKRRYFKEKTEADELFKSRDWQGYDDSEKKKRLEDLVRRHGH